MSDKTKSRNLCQQNDEKCAKCGEIGCNNEPKSAGNSTIQIQNQLLIKISYDIQSIKTLVNA